MALLASHSTAKRILDLLQSSNRAPSHAAFAPRHLSRRRLTPWTVRWSATVNSYLIYIPQGSVSGAEMEVQSLPPAEKNGKELADWYLLDMSLAETETDVRVSLYRAETGGIDVKIAPPDEHAGESPLARVLIATVTKIGVSPVSVRQVVTSALTFGGGTYYAAGPIEIVTIEDQPYLAQRWIHVSGDTLTPVTDEGIPDEDLTPRMPGGMNPDNVYASKIPMYSHIADHAEGVVKAPAK